MFNTQAMSSDYRYDVAVAGGCSVDIEQFCAEEKGQLRGTAAVLKCLVKNFLQVGVRAVGRDRQRTQVPSLQLHPPCFPLHHVCRRQKTASKR